MIVSLEASELSAFQRLIAARLGLSFDDGKLAFLAEVLARRVAASGGSRQRYLAQLERATDGEQEIFALAEELTVGETYFFRHREQLLAFAEVALPERAAARSASKRLCFLSAGCASGEEAYSLAILLRQSQLLPAYSAQIRAFDINPEALSKARRGSYSAWSLRETPAELRARWFKEQGRQLVLDPELQSSVQFSEHNLMQPSATLLPPASYDVIFCRNVLMYFAPEKAALVIERLAQALAPGGYLFLGHAETLRGVSNDFHLCHTHGTFYYQLKEGTELSSRAARVTDPPRSPLAAPAQPDAAWMGTWIETVQRTSDRIRTLTEQPASEPGRLGAKAAPGRPDLLAAQDLLRHERFAEALNVLERQPAGSTVDPDALLLRAALLTHSGELPQAEAACRELLAIDELSAGAHYLIALCHERSGAAATALDHDRIAIYLDASFAMPHLHLGLMARRSRDRATAEHELSQAMLLLQREEASRILLFGGGFNRQGLITLCRSELERLGSA